MRYGLYVVLNATISSAPTRLCLVLAARSDLSLVKPLWVFETKDLWSGLDVSAVLKPGLFPLDIYRKSPFYDETCPALFW